MQPKQTYSTTKLLVKDKPIIVNKKTDSFISHLEISNFNTGLRGLGFYKKNLKHKPVVSIITVVFNGDKYLEETIKSVLNQTYKNVEYIIIDGGSIDNTSKIIEKYNDKIDYWISEADKGIYDAMNKGITLATGEIIGIINSDDWYELNTIELVVDIYKQNRNSVIYGSMNVIKDDKKVLFEKKTNSKLSYLYKGMILNHPSIFIPMKLYKKHGLYSLSYKIASDWELILRLFLKDEEFVSIDNILSNFRLGGVSYENTIDSIKEKHKIRTDTQVFKYIDLYYIYDLVKYFVFKNRLSYISVLKQKFLSKYT